MYDYLVVTLIRVPPTTFNETYVIFCFPSVNFDLDKNNIIGVGQLHCPISKKPKTKVATGKTFTVLTASPNTGKRVAYLIVIVARAHSLFF